MLHYVVARMIKLVYNVDVYIPINIMNTLNKYFNNIDTKAVPIAEENLCGFDKFWKEYSVEKKRTLGQFIAKEYARRKLDFPQTGRNDLHRN